tara:strand:+ start:1635 stop:2864 length:1230 start_codon:yes stop_codon:yes gene_type:complete
MDKPAQQAPGANDKVRKAARQLAYDVRYKVKGQFKDGQKTDPASLKRAYMQQLGKSPAPGPVKALAKKMLIGEEYDFVNLDDAASDAILSVFEKIFEAAEGTKYTVRVKDKKTGKSYLRKADRAKIAELRKNPNISSVEIAGKGAAESDTYDKTGKGKKADKDYDGDGKIESGTAEYMGSRDKAIKKAMAKEEFIVAEGEEKEKKLDVMKGKNKVVVNPPMNEQQSTMDKDKEQTGPSPEEKKQLENKKKMLQKKMMMQRQTMQMQKQGRLPLNYSEENEGNDACLKCGEIHEGSCAPKSKESKETADSRGSYAMMNLIKNKLRARGLKMSYEPQGEMTEATEDSLRDRRMERGGVDGNTRYDRPAKNVATGPVDKKKAAESRKRAMDAVRASITAKYGKGAIMDTKKK